MADQINQSAGAQPAEHLAAGSTADAGQQTAYNTVSYTAPTTAYGAPIPQQAQYGQPRPVFVACQPAAAEQPRRRLSVPARVLLWICGVAAAVTLLFACVAIWIVGFRAINKPASDPGTDSQPPSGSFGGFGFDDGSGDYENPFGDDFGSILPYFDGGEGSGTQKSSSAGLGVKVLDIQLEFTVEDKYDAGVIIVSIEDNSAFSGTDVRENDLIVALDGVKTPTVDRLKELLGKKQVGDTVELTIARYEKGVASTYKQTVALIDMTAE